VKKWQKTAIFGAVFGALSTRAQPARLAALTLFQASRAMRPRLSWLHLRTVRNGAADRVYCTYFRFLFLEW
jgi:hypothetical protein